jgi:7-cyano-7-deazaguanine synthase in queuosine biosynthesis
VSNTLRNSSFPQLRVDVHEAGVRPRSGWTSCKIGEELEFTTEELSAYFFAKWRPEVFDALLVAAAVEFCDRLRSRRTHLWAREFDVRIPVHDPNRWNHREVNSALHDALCFLTGDRWNIEFVARKRSHPRPMQSTFELPGESCAVIPFSEGMDSRAVAGLMSERFGDKLVRIRLGTKAADAETLPRYGHPFTSVPYAVHFSHHRTGDTSARSRGFKFATISGLSAYLAKASQIIVPESGQGSLGPVLVPVGQAYEDYRNHPLFTDRMENYLEALLGYRPRFEFPRLWFTKGETLKEFAETCEDGHAWESTRSCWQQSRQASVDGSRRQCGICAACMLRRLSVHAAGLSERKETYLWENLKVSTFEKGAANGFEHITDKLRDYAIAGTLHLDHLAALRSTRSGRASIDVAAFHLGRSRELQEADARAKLERVLTKHENEWRAFMNSLGNRSFVVDWAAHAR